MATLGHRVVVAILGVGLTARAAHADDWGTPGLDLGHSRSSAERSGASFADAKWTVSVPGWTSSSPVVADGFVVSANLDGVVTAMRADTGDVAWKVSLGATVQGTPALARGRVFVPTVSNMMYALRLTDGAVVWMQDIGGMTVSSPIALDGDIVVAPGFPQMNVVRLSGATGEVVWRSPQAMWQFGNSAPAVGGGLVVVGSQGGRYYGFDAATGALLWEYIGDGIVNQAAPIIVGGRVYMAGGDQSHRVHAVDVATGVAVPGWPIDLPTPAPDIAGTRQGGWRAISSFAAVGGLLLLQTRLDDALGPRPSGPFHWLSREFAVALDPASGTIAWQRPTARAENMDVNNVPKFFMCPTPAGYATDARSPLVAVASSLDAVVAVLDPKTGNELTRQPVAGPTLGSPVLANGRLYTTSMTGTTQALGSSVNRAPATPVAVGSDAPIDLATGRLSWSSAVDPEGEAASYELRIDRDGEILESWERQLFVAAGITSTAIGAELGAGVSYQFAVRARDSRGAMSSWSKPVPFTVTGMVPPPAVATATGLTTGTGPGAAPGPAPTPGPDPAAAPGAAPRPAPAPQVAPAAAGTMVTTTSSPEIATAGTGCSMTGGTAAGWATPLLLAGLCALRVRRRRPAAT